LNGSDLADFAERLPPDYGYFSEQILLGSSSRHFDDLHPVATVPEPCRIFPVQRKRS